MAHDKIEPRKQLIRIMYIFNVLWIVFFIGAYFWGIKVKKEEVFQLAAKEAEASFNKDLVYRRWAASHGGLYVPITDETPPNQFLKDIKERDITTPSGKKLTLLNPAYMTRQVHDLSAKQYGVLGHITSLKPIRSENKPDEWEKAALIEFTKGKEEISSIAQIDGKPYLRYMKRLITEDRCLKCHATQGYQRGDIRGGISTSVPMNPYYQLSSKHLTVTSIVLFFIWLVGILLFNFGSLILSRQLKTKEKIEERLEVQKRILSKSQEIAHLGSWHLDIKKNILTWSDEEYRIFGRSPQEFGATYEAFLDTIHPDDRGMVDKTYSNAIENNLPYECIHRIIRPDGEIRVVLEKSEDIIDEKGETIHSFGYTQDITEQKKAEDILRISQDSLIAAQKIAQLGSWSWDIAKNKIVWSDELYQIMGFQKGQLKADYETYLDRIHPDDKERFAKLTENVLRDKKPYSMEYKLVRPNGEEVYVIERGKVQLGENATPVKLVGTVQDISMQKKAAEKLIKSEALLAVTEKISQVGGWQYNLEDETMFWTEETFRIHDLSAEDFFATEYNLIEKSLACYDPADQVTIKNAFQLCVIDGIPYDLEFPFTTAKGRNIFIRTVANRIGDKEIGFRVIGNMIDITESKLVKENLRKEKEFLEKLTNSLGEAIFTVKLPERVVDFVNPAIETIFGYSKEECLGMQTSIFYPSNEEYIDFGRKLQQAIEQEQSILITKQMLKRKNGELFPCEITTILFSQDGGVGGVISIVRDITESEKAEKQLLMAKEEWERTFNAMNDIVTLQDIDMNIVKVNQAGCDSLSLSCENIIGQYCYELFHGSSEPCPECPLLLSKETFEPYSKEMTHEKLGKTFLVSAAPVLDDQGNMTHIAHVAKDITEKKKIEERLFLNEKMATIAGLAAGVAHEINTPLSGILQSQQIIEMKLDPDKPRNQERAAECGLDLTKVETYFKNNELDVFMKGMRDSAITAGNIIKNLLEFSRPHKGEIKNTNLSNLLDTSLELARSDYDLKRQYDIINVEIVKEYDADLTEVPCVAMEIEQVLLNLIKNAVHAMTDNKTENPCITVRTVKKEKMARIEVEDNGSGIDEETQLHIFDPFFTTKEVGQGTGLGLSVSHALIVDKHRGNIWVESDPGKGAKFIIELPLVQDV
jgi:PAS domain S-box-containing protein